MDGASIEMKLGILIGKVESIEDHLDRADNSRREIHESVNALVLRATNIESDVLSVKNRVDVVEAVTASVQTMRERAIGAGTAGHWLIKIGIGVLAVAGWLAAAYTQLTGKPPP